MGALASGGPRHTTSRGAARMKAGSRAAAVLCVWLAAPAAAGAASRPDVPTWKVVEVVLPANGPDEAVLGRPLSLALGSGALYIVDAQDCAVKVFSRDGRFLKSIGRKGSGPGELSFPSGVAVLGGRIFVADKLNRRVQIFEASGRPGGGFSVPFAPDRAVTVGGNCLLLTSNPTGRPGAGKMLHIYDGEGRLRGEALDALVSGDAVFDAFRNMILVCAGPAGEFFVVRRSGERLISRFDGSGALLGTIPVDEAHPVRPVDLPFKGPRKRLFGFCWAAAWDRGFFYIAAPEPVEGRDLGPGRRVSVLDGRGRLAGVVELPCPVHRFAVDGGRIFAVDEEAELRIFEVVR